MTEGDEDTTDRWGDRAGSALPLDCVLAVDTLLPLDCVLAVDTLLPLDCVHLPSELPDRVRSDSPSPQLDDDRSTVAVGSNRSATSVGSAGTASRRSDSSVGCVAVSR